MKRVLPIPLLLFVLAACGEQKHDFDLLVPALPFDQEIAAELATVFEEHSGHSIRLKQAPSEFETALDALEAGHGDLAFASNAQSYRQGVTTVMPLYPTVLHILHKRDRDTSDLRSLFQGAVIFAGPIGSSSRQLTASILDDLDISGTDYSFASDADLVPDVNVIYLAISPDSVSTRLKEIGATDVYQMLSFGAPDDVGTGSPVDRAVLLNPRLSAFLIPTGTYGDVTPEPVVTLAVDKLLVANPDIPNAEIYDLINEIRRLQPALSATRPMLYQGLSDEFDASDSTFVLHAGAQAFVQRDAPDVYERYSGVAEVLVTLVIGAISGVYAVVQIYNRRRKNRIDRFYTDVIALRDSIKGGSSADDRSAAAEKVRALQNKAFEMLVDEKLAADESFRIFITLSNDIIAELGQTGS